MDPHSSQANASFNLVPLTLHLLSKAVAAGSPFTVDGICIHRV